jgi:hypothetical protein
MEDGLNNCWNKQTEITRDDSDTDSTWCGESLIQELVQRKICLRQEACCSRQDLLRSRPPKRVHIAGFKEQVRILRVLISAMMIEKGLAIVPPQPTRQDQAAGDVQWRRGF